MAAADAYREAPRSAAGARPATVGPAVLLADQLVGLLGKARHRRTGLLRHREPALCGLAPHPEFVDVGHRAGVQGIGLRRDDPKR